MILLFLLDVPYAHQGIYFYIFIRNMVKTAILLNITI